MANVFRSRLRQVPGFTILELISVMAIIALMAAALLPVVTSLSKSSSRRAAINLTLSTLDQTRALAISRNSNHYLVFASNDPSWPEDYRCRSFAIYEEIYTPTTDPAIPPYKWFPVTNWTKLPVGVAFDPVATVFANVPSDASAPKSFYCNFLGRQMTGAYFKFSSIGAVEEPTTTDLACVKIFEGFLDASGNLVFTNKAKKAEELIKISPVTGRAKRIQPEDL